jgi:SHS2 domain-containing protein
MERYKFIDNITSDVVFEAYGKELKDVFTHAADALSTMICKVKLVKPKKEIKIEVNGDSAEDLMINWLQSIIANVDIESMFFSKFTITEISDRHLVAFAYGEDISPEKGNTVVKAVTYHQFSFKKTEDGYVCRVSLDI